MPQVIHIDGLGNVLEDDHQHVLVYGGVEPAETIPLDWTYFATETFPC